MGGAPELLLGLGNHHFPKGLAGLALSEPTRGFPDSKSGFCRIFLPQAAI
jgi:hypothetical protein